MEHYDIAKRGPPNLSYTQLCKAYFTGKTEEFASARRDILQTMQTATLIHEYH